MGIPTDIAELRRDFETIGGRYRDAFGTRRRLFLVYGGEGHFNVVAADDGGGFIVADAIKNKDWAHVVADMLNLAATCAGSPPSSEDYP